MYGMRLNTAEKRQEAREFRLRGFEVHEYPEYNCIIGIKSKELIAIAFIGTAGNPAWHYSFRTPEGMQKYINDFLESQKKNLEYKQERKNKRKAPALSAVPFKPGDILYDSWGWEQTNVDFYEVVEVRTASTIVLRQIAQNTEETGFMSGHTTPRPGEFIGEPIIKRIQWYEGRPYIKSEFGCISKWDGRPVHCSWYA
jgi:hypothetical protein